MEPLNLNYLINGALLAALYYLSQFQIPYVTFWTNIATLAMWVAMSLLDASMPELKYPKWLRMAKPFGMATSILLIIYGLVGIYVGADW